MTKTGKKINGKQKLTPSDIVVHIIPVSYTHLRAHET